MTQAMPTPWSTERSNIPWDEPEFSKRMLDAHLNQAHDAASRTFEHIDRQVEWIDQSLLDSTPSRILDLGCGPGLHTERFAPRGHRCHGIDFSPASIAHARETAARNDLACSYEQHDVRTAQFGSGFDLVTFLYGEPSVFSPHQLRSIITRAAAALVPGGLLLLEPHTERGVAMIGEEPPSNMQVDTGLFLDAPHRLRSANSFDQDTRIATKQWLVEPTDGSPASEHLAWYQSYSDEELNSLIEACGFVAGSINVHSNLVDQTDTPAFQFVSAMRRQ